MKSGSPASGLGATVIDYNSYNYVNGFASNGGGFATGSAGDISSVLTNTIFGIQDLFGGRPEFLADQLYCLNPYGCSAGFTDLSVAIPSTAYNPLCPHCKARLKNGDGQYLNMSTGDSYLPMFDSNTRYYYNQYHSGIAPGQVVINQYSSPVNGMPLACSGLACSAATDDNAVLSSTLQTNSVTEVFQDRSADLFNRRFLSESPMMTTTGSAATVLHGAYDTNFNGGVTLHGFNLSNTVEHYGARCGVKLGEDNQDAFTAPEYD
jgi:hypothetical protein